MRKSRIMRFLGLLLLVYGAWYVVYDLWLLPDGRLDYWVGTQMAGLISAFLADAGLPAWSAGRIVWIEGAAGIEIIEGCTPLKTISVFIGVALAYPAARRTRMWFVPVGILIIAGISFWRLTLLVLTQHVAPGLFSLAHDEIFTLLNHLVVFGLWVVVISSGEGRGGFRPRTEDGGARGGGNVWTLAKRLTSIASK